MLRQLKLAFVALALTIVCFSAAARADTFTVSGDTFLNPTGTFNRTVENGQSLSVLATNVAYSSYQFTVMSSGTYNFLSVSQERFIYDPFLALYSGSFNPANPLLNFVAANDDFNGSFFESSFTASLSTGTNYFLITTGHSNLDSGAFINTITSQTAPHPVPEPATMILLGTGILGVATRVRARRKS